MQLQIAKSRPQLWHPGQGVLAIGACYVCFERNTSGAGDLGDHAWAAAVLNRGRRAGAEVGLNGVAGSPYISGVMALREGPLLEAAVRLLPDRPDVMLVNATGHDHPRRCGLAVQLGLVLDIPTVGVTHRVLLATGPEPADRRGASSDLRIGGDIVGSWLRTRPGSRPIAVHAGWRTEPETAVRVVMAASRRARTPEPLRRARRAARLARAARASGGPSASSAGPLIR